ncbi:MAG: molybdopterin-binding protein [Acidobacteriota bacterium]|nr:molybdopterin-binding protein [Acidobacteriota bacterium]
MQFPVSWRMLIFGLIAIFLSAEICAQVPRASDSETEFVVVVTGRELLEGAYADAHTQFLARTLLPLGGRCVGSVTVTDDEKEMLRALEYASRRSRIVIVTGGLGPTGDDITRQTLAEYTGIPLQESSQVIQEYRRRYGDRVFRPSLRRQAQVPSRGAYLKNRVGSAVGLVFDDGQRVVVALPGPPRELRPMVREQLIPFLARRFGIQAAVESVTLRFVGIGESSIQSVIDKHVNLPSGVRVASTFEAGRVDLTFYGHSGLPGIRKSLLGLRDRMLEQLGQHVYSVGGSTLEETILRLLADRKATLAVAEVATGGGLSSRLTGTPSAPSVLFGSYVAATNAGIKGLLASEGSEASGQVPEGNEAILDLARKVASDQRDRWVLLVSQLEEGDADRVTLCAGSRAHGFAVESVGFRTGRSGRERLITRALDFLRRRLAQ